MLRRYFARLEIETGDDFDHVLATAMASRTNWKSQPVAADQFWLCGYETAHLPDGLEPH